MTLNISAYGVEFYDRTSAVPTLVGWAEGYSWFGLELAGTYSVTLGISAAMGAGWFFAGMFGRFKKIT